MNNELLFNFLDPNHNDQLKKLDGMKRKRLFEYLECFYLTLRPVLGFDKKITFGLEIEFENIRKDNIVYNLCQKGYNDCWHLVYDDSLHSGAEIISSILKDNQRTWNELTDICSLVEHDGRIGKNSGGHIHIGVQVLGSKRETWLNFIKLYSVYESIIFRFVYGNFLTERPDIVHYAKPIALKLLNDYPILEKYSLEEIITLINYGKYHAVNFNHISNFHQFIYGNTIEFRSPNGTLDPVIWQNNVHLFVKLLEYAKNSLYDIELVNTRYKTNLNTYSDLSYYRDIHLMQALELSDMIFSNNLDKLYFLRQYLKSFEVGTKSMQLAKRFTAK